MTSADEALVWYQRQQAIKQYDSVRDALHALVDAQYEKGIQTYGVPLEKAQNVNLSVMALEEMHDMCAYLLQELRRVDGENADLRRRLGDE